MSPPRFVEKLGREFTISVEAVPPKAATCDDLAENLAGALRRLPIDAVNLADNPRACPRLSSVLFAGAVRVATAGAVEVIPHITVRDRNRVALQGDLWGAVAIGTRVVLIASGDPVRYSSMAGARRVADLTVPELVRIARELALVAGVVMDPRRRQRHEELRKLERKLDAGANFVITQPVYDRQSLDDLCHDLDPFGIPVLLGILPLINARHARFLHEQVQGISIPKALLQRMGDAPDPLQEGLANARLMLAGARERCAGVDIMPPFNRFNLVPELLEMPVSTADAPAPQEMA